MNVSGLKTFCVNDNQYSVEDLPPAQALSFGLKAATVLGPILGKLCAIADSKDVSTNQQVLEVLGESIGKLDDAKLKELCDTALSHCFTPENKSLADTGEYDRWFSTHKSDLLVVAIRAVFLLSKDFFPKGLHI